jgi:hypothetical protein
MFHIFNKKLDITWSTTKKESLNLDLPNSRYEFYKNTAKLDLNLNPNPKPDTDTRVPWSQRPDPSIT